MAKLPTTKNSITHSGKVIYLTNKELLAEVIRSKEMGRMSEPLAKMLMLLCAKYAKKGNFVNYSYNEDMQGYALMMLCRTWNSFNPERSSNPFAYFTQSIKNSYIQMLNQEKRQRVIRDELLVEQGSVPSHSYSDGRTLVNLDDEQDFETTRVSVDVTKASISSYDPIERDEKGQEVIAIEVDEDDNPI